MSHDHNHSHKLGIGIVLNLVITALEYAAGFLSGSLALISDASHNLTDVLSLVVAGAAEKVSKKKSTGQKTFGYARATTLGALLNTLLLFALSLYIFYEAYQRFLSPTLINPYITMIVALITALFNGIMAFVFSGNKKDLNIRGVFLHQVYDALSSVGALIGGILVYFTHNPIFDVLVSVIIGIMMLVSCFGLIRKTFHVLLEGVPEDVDIEEVRRTLLELPLAKDIHDLHIWSLSSHFVALSCHILIDQNDVPKSMSLLEKAKEVLREKFEITHSTIEIEVVKCEEGVVC